MVMSNHYAAPWPQSPFVAQPVLVRKDEHQVCRLLGRQLSHTRPGAATQQWQLTDSRFVAALHDLGLDYLDPADVVAVIATLPPS
jgi:arylamine N-acetyltransferase